MSRETLFDRELLSYFQAMKYEYRLNPLVLGATSGSGGGSGAPPGGIVGQLAQIYVAGDQTESTVYTTGSIGSLLDNLNNIRAWGEPTRDFFVTQTDPLSSTVSVGGGEWYYIDGTAPLVYAGGTSPAISAPVGGNRFDLLTINTGGDLAWTSGSVSATPSLPAFPSATAGILPLWAIYSRSSGSAIVNVDDGINHYLYKDYRPFIGGPTVFPSSGSSYIDYQWYADGPLSTGSGINGVYYVPDAFALAGSFGYVKTTPSSGSVIVDFQYSTDNGINWSSVYSGSTLTILSGDNYGSQTPQLITLGAGTLLRANLTNAGGGAASSLSANLFGTIRSASGAGTVSNVSVTAIDGIIGSVTNPTTSPSINLSLGNITPDSVVSSGSVSGINLSGINTGDQYIVLSGDVTGAGTGAILTALATTGVTPGTYTLATVTFDEDGRALYATSGSGTASIYPYPSEPVGSSSTSGSSVDAAAGDHVHRGVSSVIAQGYTSAFGDIMIVPGTNVTLGYSSGSITINSTGGGGGGVTSIVEQGGTPATGAITLIPGSAVTIVQSPAGTFTIDMTSGSTGVVLASVAEAQAGTNTTKAVSPAGLPLRVENGTLIHNQSYGGNARGNNGVDFQSVRSDPSYVASGVGSAILSGSDNTSSGEYSSVIGGSNAVASNYGQVSHASGPFTTPGDAQDSGMVARREIDHSIDTGWQNLYLDGASTSIIVPTNSAWTVDILISAADIGLTSRGYYRILGAVANIAGTTQIDAQTVTTIFETTAAWDVQLAVTGANLLIQVTDGTDTETLRWVATIRTCELSYPA